MGEVAGAYVRVAPTAVVAMAQRGIWRRGADVFESRRVLAAALIAPAIAFILLLVGAPLVLSIYLSFTDATAGSLHGHWVGLANFRDEWHNPIFRHAVRNTIVITLVSQTVIVVCAAILSNYLARPFKGRWILRFLILLPWAAPIALGAITWLWIFDSLYSVINWVLVHVHLVSAINPPQWLGRPNLAMASIITVQSWRVLPFAVVIFLAGHASIPQEVNDAAKLDAATGLKKLWYVTLPLQLPIALVAILFGIVFTATDMAVVYLLTNGNPANSTHVLTTWAFAKGINAGSLGEGAAISLYLFPLLLVVTIAMLFFARRAQVS